MENLEDDLKELKEKLVNTNFFKKNTDFIIYEKDKLHYKDFYTLLNEYGHNLYLVKKVETEKFIKKTNKLDENTLILRKTLRSGQKVEFSGNVIVVGDINPGAEVIAEGDVYIFGKLKGLAHAGSSGDLKREIIAMSMDAKQLRIGDVYTKSGEDKPLYKTPEKAFLDDKKNLVLEQYNCI